MRCARTAALQGGYEKQKVNASRDFLQHSLLHVQKSLESNAKPQEAQCRTKCMKKLRKIQPRDLPTLPWTLPEPSEIESGALLGSLRQPGDTQERPREAQEPSKTRPRSAQEVPKSAQEPSRRRRGGSKPLQNRAQGHPRRDFGTCLVQRSVCKAPGPIFLSFLIGARHA